MVLEKLEVKRNKPVVKILSEKFGGEWTYLHCGMWQDDTGDRFVYKVSMCGCDDVCNHPPGYFYYTKSETPRFLGTSIL